MGSEDWSRVSDGLQSVSCRTQRGRSQRRSCSEPLVNRCRSRSELLRGQLRSVNMLSSAMRRQLTNSMCKSKIASLQKYYCLPSCQTRQFKRLSPISTLKLLVQCQDVSMSLISNRSLVSVGVHCSTPLLKPDHVPSSSDTQATLA